MMRIKFTPAMLFAVTGSKYALNQPGTGKKQIRPNHQRRLPIPSTRTVEAIWREMPPIRSFSIASMELDHRQEIS